MDATIRLPRYRDLPARAIAPDDWDTSGTPTGSVPRYIDLLPPTPLPCGLRIWASRYPPRVWHTLTIRSN